MKPKVFVTRGVVSKFAPDEFAVLEKECEVEVFPHERVIQKNELVEKVKGKQAVLYSIGDPFFDREIMDAGSELKIIASVGVGFGHIDIAAATERKIMVANTYSDYICWAVAEATWTLLFAVAKRLNEGEWDVRAGRFPGWRLQDYIGADVGGQCLGIIGLGRIGKKVAQSARGWDMKILYHDIIDIDPKVEKELKVTRVSQETLLKEADFVSLHVPLTKEGPTKTYHLIGEKELALMKPTAYIINTCRGPVIEEEVLVRFLKEKRIAGAALDVYEKEPELAAGLSELSNVVLAPHSASATPKARRSYAALGVQNLLAGIRGETPPNLVNIEVLNK